MARTKVVLNKQGIRALLNSPEVVAALEARARPVLAAAKADPHDATGAYESGLHMETEKRRTRARVKVVSSDYKGHILEARYGILARALDGASGLVNYTRKDGKTIKVTAAQAANYSRRR